MLYVIGCTTAHADEPALAPVILGAANTFFAAKQHLLNNLDIAARAYPQEESYADAYKAVEAIMPAQNLQELAVKADESTYWIKRYVHSEERGLLSTLTCINEAVRLGLGSADPKHHEAALNDILGHINENKALLEALGEE